MQTTKTARRYAKALMGLAKELDEIESIQKDMELIHGTLDGSNELVLLLKSPVVKSADKERILKEIFSDKVTEPTNRFFSLLVEKDREDQLGGIASAYLKLYDEYKGIQQVEVTVAHNLSEDQQEELSKELEVRTGKTIRMNVTVDESLMGGIQVRMEDTVIDGSVRYKLEELRHLLHGTTLN